MINILANMNIYAQARIQPAGLNETYKFVSYGDEQGSTEFAKGTASVTGINTENYFEIIVETNTVDGFVGNRYWVSKDAEYGENLYQLYEDGEGETGTGLYVKIGLIYTSNVMPKKYTENQNEDPVDDPVEDTVEDPVVTCVDNIVTMTCSTSEASINYSTDEGTTYSVYSTPITISATTNYSVYASKDGMTDSNIVTYTATYEELDPIEDQDPVEDTVEDPVVSCTDNVVTMTCSTSEASINYSTDEGSTYSVYSTPITILATTNYSVYASKDGMTDSNIVNYTATYEEPII